MKLPIKKWSCRAIFALLSVPTTIFSMERPSIKAVELTWPEVRAGAILRLQMQISVLEGQIEGLQFTRQILQDAKQTDEMRQQIENVDRLIQNLKLKKSRVETLVDREKAIEAIEIGGQYGAYGQPYTQKDFDDAYSRYLAQARKEGKVGDYNVNFSPKQKLPRLAPQSKQPSIKEQMQLISEQISYLDGQIQALQSARQNDIQIQNLQFVHLRLQKELARGETPQRDVKATAERIQHLQSEQQNDGHMQALQFARNLLQDTLAEYQRHIPK